MKNEKSLRMAMIKPNNTKLLMIISGVLLVLALIGMAITVFKPAQVKQETNLISYIQKSQFDYATYLKPSYLYGPTPTTPVDATQYPQAVVGNIAFTYSFQPTAANASGTAWVDVILENPGIWQKKLALVPNTTTSGNYALNFTLDMQQINQLITGIENETGLSSSSSLVTLNAYFQSGSVLQIQSLPITLKNNLVVIPNSLTLTQDAGSGQFDYKISPVLPTPQVPDVSYPFTVIDSIGFTFTFVPTVPAASTASVQAILENPGIWQKTINLVPATATNGNVSLSFPLSPDQLQQQFDAIDKETGLTTSTRVVTIQATVSYGKDSFVQSLPLTLKESVLEVGGNLQQQQSIGIGKFDYVINLKPNSIYDTTTLKPPTAAVPTTLPSFDLSGKPVVVTTNSPSTLQPGQTAFVNLIDKINVDFGYQFAADKPVNNLKTIVDIVATLEAPQSWSKSFTLLHNEQSGNITVNFPIDIAGYSQLLSSIRTETGVSPDSYNLTIIANIHTTGDTAFGPIDETFSPTMSGTIKNNVLVWDKDLTDSKTGAIAQTATIDNPNKILGFSVSAARPIFILLSCLLAGLLVGLLVLHYLRREPNPAHVNLEVQKIQKKYGARIAESVGTPFIEGEMPISMNSMEDLIKIADELGKPVVHQSAGPTWEVQSYYVIDGSTRYQYSIPSDKSSQETDEREEDRTEEPQ